MQRPGHQPALCVSMSMSWQTVCTAHLVACPGQRSCRLVGGRPALHCLCAPAPSGTTATGKQGECALRDAAAGALRGRGTCPSLASGAVGAAVGLRAALIGMLRWRMRVRRLRRRGAGQRRRWRLHRRGRLRQWRQSRRGQLGQRRLSRRGRQRLRGRERCSGTRLGVAQLRERCSGIRLAAILLRERCCGI